MALCILFCGALALDALPGLRGDYGWRWPYAVPGDWRRVVPALLVTALYVVGFARLRHGRLSVLLAWCIGGAALIALACLFILGDPLYALFTRTVSGLATGAHEAGAEITDLGAALRQWPTLMPTYLEPGKHSMESVHIALDPPGLAVLYYAADRLLAALPALAEPLGMALRGYQCQNFAIMAYDNATLASAWLGMLTPLWAGLTALPLYATARQLDGEPTARLAVGLWPLVPALALFTPTGNTVYPLLTMSAAAALVYGLKNRRFGFICVSGAVTSLATFLNFSTIPFIGFIGMVALLDAAVRRQRWLQPIRAGAVFGVGLASVWGGYWALSGNTPLAILNVALGHHLELDRPYLPWLYLHPYDLALFAGLPISLLAVIAIGQAARRGLNAASVLPLAFAISVLVVDLSGTARGETGRVWLFFIPLIVLLAARVLAESESETGGRAYIGAAFAVQAVTLITLVAFLRVMGTELTPPPNAPPANVSPANNPAASGAAVAFTDASGSAFTLIGHAEAFDKATSAITLQLAWYTERAMAVPYYFAALLVRPDGTPQPPTINWQPQATTYPTTCWAPGSVVYDTIRLPLASGAPPGDWWISLSAFDLRTHAALNVNTSDRQVGIGPVRVVRAFF